MADRTLIPADPEIWRRTGHAVPACTADACGQDPSRCPCPESCEVPIDRALRATFWRLYIAALIVAVGYGVSLLLPLVKQ